MEWDTFEATVTRGATLMTRVVTSDRPVTNPSQETERVLFITRQKLPLRSSLVKNHALHSSSLTGLMQLESLGDA